MTARLDPMDPDATRRMELRALEKMVRALCRHIEQLSREADARGELDSREAELQLEAFAERRGEAAQVLEPAAKEPYALRVSRLEKLVEALECSRAYFRSPAAGHDSSPFDPRPWLRRRRGSG